MYYVLCLAILLAIYFTLIFFMNRLKNAKLMNAVFIALTVVCYIVLVVYVYLDVGLYDWNFLNVLPTANVSPFMFFTLILYAVLPSKIKKHWSVLICLLSLGMLFAAILGCVTRAATGYKFHFTFVLDYVSHLSLSLLGIYLAKTDQVKLNKKDCILGGSLIVIVAVIMLVINLIAGTSFFGLALNEKYNIYNMVLVPNCYLSALLYFVGLIGVLVLGYFYIKLLTLKKRKNRK